MAENTSVSDKKAFTTSLSEWSNTMTGLIINDYNYWVLPNGMCGRYEKEIAEMFLKAFDDSEEKNVCDCQHSSNSRDDEPCCRCDSRQTNADRIRNMSDEKLAEFLVGFKNTFGEEYEGQISCLDWLQSEAE